MAERKLANEIRMKTSQWRLISANHATVWQRCYQMHFFLAVLWVQSLRN